MDKIEKLAARLAESEIALSRGVLLSEHSTFGIGGPADLFVQPQSEEQTAQVFIAAGEYKVPLLVLGRGSNVLFADAGYRGAVLHLGDKFSRIWQDGPNKIRCQSGVKLSELCRYAEKQGLAGMEFAYGIPGTVGGAVYMNAGAYGSEIKDVITGARFAGTDGSVKELCPDEMGLEYRHSAFMGMSGAITEAAFELTPGCPKEIRAKMDDYMSRRRSSQPLAYPSAGSTFKRPPGNYASALIDQCGLKGLRVGGAVVSEKHAGFVVNTGGATCEDVLTLIAKIQEQVKAQTGYELECEVKIIAAEGRQPIG